MAPRQALFLFQFEGAKQTTLDAYNLDLRYLGEWLNEKGKTIEKMTAQDWQRFVHEKGWGFSAQKRALSAARRYLRQEDIKAPGIGRIMGKKHPLFRVPYAKGKRKEPRTLRLEQLDKLLAACEGTHKPIRNRALILIMWDCGLRRREVARLEWRNVDFARKRIKVRTKAVSLEERHNETKRFFGEAEKALQKWGEISTTLRVFGLSFEGVSSLIKRLAGKVDFPVSPHDFRRGRGAHFAENGVSDRLAMKQLGISTHKVYMDYSGGADLDALDRFIE